MSIENALDAADGSKPAQLIEGAALFIKTPRYKVQRPR